VLRASADLERRGLPTHTLVVGGDAHALSPEYGPQLERLVENLGLQPHVTFTGQVPDAAPYLALMDVLVNASDPEPFGIVLLEGMARGVAVVAVDSGGPTEIIEHERSGLLVESADELAIADALERLLVDDDLRGRIAAGGRRRFESSFTSNRMVDELQSQLEAVMR
jgi:glycosyltransferase involved in cell wall biosynthesis